MRLLLVRTSADAAPRVGISLAADDARVLDVTAATAATSRPIRTMRDYLTLVHAAPADAAPDTRAAIDALVAAERAGTAAADLVLAAGAYTRCAPIYDPEKVICVGMNYADHCTEQGLPIPKEPVLFNKFPSSIIADGEPLVKPPETEELDFEVELVIVIGKPGRRIPRARAMEHVAGFTVAHDVSARDWQLKRNGGQWMVGKAIDGFCPLGPAIVTPDDLPDPHKLAIYCSLNGARVQDSSTEQLVHKTDAILEFASRFFTLRPGDLILTGTPPGVGCFRKPPLWLKSGDVVTVGVEGIGEITNTVVDEVIEPAEATGADGAAGGGGGGGSA